MEEAFGAEEEEVIQEEGWRIGGSPLHKTGEFVSDADLGVSSP